MLPTTTHNHPRLYRKRPAQRGQGSWARNACAQEIQQIITYELTCLFVASLSSALDNCTEHDSSNCWCSLESRESPVRVQLLQNDRPRIRTNSNETEWNRTERNRTRTKLNVIERCCTQFPFGFWLNMTKRNGIVLNDIGNVFLTHSVIYLESDECCTLWVTSFCTYTSYNANCFYKPLFGCH